MSKQTKHWSIMIEEFGVRIRVYENPRSSFLWYSTIQGTRKVRKSLKTADRALAEQRAKDIARELARAVLSGEDIRTLTLGQLFDLYRRERVPFLTHDLARRVEYCMLRFAAIWGEALELSNLSPTHVTRFVAVRRADGVRDGTIDCAFRWLRSVFNFARRHRVGGRPVLSVNPLDGITWPKELNPRRPIASHERYLRTQEHTDAVDPDGRLRCILALARYTGRRRSAIVGLRANDVLRDDDAVARELAEAGMDERIAGHMPNGAIRWSSTTDKEGFLFIAPLSEPAREELDRYLGKSPRLGDVPLFPACRDKGKVLDMATAGRWLIEAESAAGLPKLSKGRWHPYRRLWASERKALPDVDVAEAGGWRDTKAMRESYIQSDAATVLRVVESTA